MNVYVKTIIDLCEAIGGARALSLAILLRNVDPKNLGASFKTLLDLSPNDFNCPNDYLRYAQATSLVSKNANFELSSDAVYNTVKKWFESEQRCFETNLRLKNNHESWFDMRLNTARDILMSVVGQVPEQLYHNFTNGASLDAGGSEKQMFYKLLENPKYTPRATKYIQSLRKTDWQFCEIHNSFSDQLVDHNELLFIPKSWKELRGICIASVANMSLQKFRGNYIRHRLKKWGYDLSVMQDQHKLLACKASISNGASTIDLRAASDSLATATVERLMSSEWFTFLNDVRETYTKCPNDKMHYNQKFSAMGNGFTFELETLIFLSLCYAVHTHDETFCGPPLISVYGDDIIVEKRITANVIKLLAYIGFETNIDKTFVDGPFRESCGGDYWLGIDVRPIYLKKDVSSYENQITFVNSIRRISRLSLCNYGCDPAFKRAWLRSQKLIDKRKLCYGPEDCGNTLIWIGQSEYVGNYYQYWRKQFWAYTRVLRRDKTAIWKNLPHAVWTSEFGDSRITKQGSSLYRKIRLSSIRGWDSTWEWVG